MNINDEVEIAIVALCLLAIIGVVLSGFAIKEFDDRDAPCNGPVGPQGLRGANGPSGPSGPSGPQGPPAKAIYGPVVQVLACTQQSSYTTVKGIQPVQFDNIAYENKLAGSSFNLNTFIFTAPVPGVYYVNYVVNAQRANAVANLVCLIGVTRKGTTTYDNVSSKYQASNTAWFPVGGSMVLTLNAGDSVGIYTQDNVGGQFAVLSNTSAQFIFLNRIPPQSSS